MESSYDSTSGRGDAVDFGRRGGWTSWSSLLVVLTCLAPLTALCLVPLALVAALVLPGGFWLWLALYFAVPAVLMVPGLESLQAWLACPRSRRPSPEDRARVAPLWDRVLARVGHDRRRRYRLRVSDDQRTTAIAGGGRLVTVTAGALARLSDEELEAVLAHAYGHQVGLLPVVLLSQRWLARPLGWTARLSAALRDAVGSPTRGQMRPFVFVLAWAFVLLVRAVLLVLDSVVMAARLVLAFLGRRAQYSADAVAVRLGYGPALIAALAAAEGQHEAEPAEERRRRFPRRRGRRRRRAASAEDASAEDQTSSRTSPLWEVQPDSADRIARIRDSISR